MTLSKVIVDIDGTLADCSERAKMYLEGENKNWDKFYGACINDYPILSVIDIVQNISSCYEIILCSGRRESCREDTIRWLEDNEVPYNEILLREDGDFRHDTIVKPELLKKANIKESEVAFILEDRNSMVAKWRELGFTCLQVAEGDF